MKEFILITSEGVPLLQRPINCVEHYSEDQVSRFAKYFVLSMGIWEQNVHSQIIKNDIFWAYIIRRFVEGKELFFCVVESFLSRGPCGEKTLQLQSNTFGDLTCLALFKISNAFISNYGKELAVILEVVSNELRKAMDNGSFSESVGSIAHFSDILDSCDEFQEFKLSIEQSPLDNCLSDPKLHLTSLLDGLHSMQDSQIYVSSLKCLDNVASNAHYNLYTCSDLRILKVAKEISCDIAFARAEVLYSFIAKLSHGRYLIRAVKNLFSIEMDISLQFEIETSESFEIALDTSLSEKIELFLSSLESELLST